MAARKVTAYIVCYSNIDYKTIINGFTSYKAARDYAKRCNSTLLQDREAYKVVPVILNKQ